MKIILIEAGMNADSDTIDYWLADTYGWHELTLWIQCTLLAWKSNVANHCSSLECEIFTRKPISTEKRNRIRICCFILLFFLLMCFFNEDSIFGCRLLCLQVNHLGIFLPAHVFTYSYLTRILKKKTHTKNCLNEL